MESKNREIFERGKLAKIKGQKGVMKELISYKNIKIIKLRIAAAIPLKNSVSYYNAPVEDLLLLFTFSFYGPQIPSHRPANE